MTSATPMSIRAIAAEVARVDQAMPAMPSHASFGTSARAILRRRGENSASAAEQQDERDRRAQL